MKVCPTCRAPVADTRRTCPICDTSLSQRTTSEAGGRPTSVTDQPVAPTPGRRPVVAAGVDDEVIAVSVEQVPGGSVGRALTGLVILASVVLALYVLAGVATEATVALLAPLALLVVVYVIGATFIGAPFHRVVYAFSRIAVGLLRVSTRLFGLRPRLGASGPPLPVGVIVFRIRRPDGTVVEHHLRGHSQGIRLGDRVRVRGIGFPARTEAYMVRNLTTGTVLVRRGAVASCLLLALLLAGAVVVLTRQAL